MQTFVLKGYEYEKNCSTLFNCLYASFRFCFLRSCRTDDGNDDGDGGYAGKIIFG